MSYSDRTQFQLFALVMTFLISQLTGLDRRNSKSQFISVTITKNYLFKIAFVAAIEFIYFCHISSADGARFTAAGIPRFLTYHALTAIAHIILMLCWRKVSAGNRLDR